MRLIYFLLLITVATNAQNNPSTGEFCGSDYLHFLKMQNDSLYSKRMNAFEAQLKSATNTNDEAILIIPVVVHVMHKGEALGVGNNISDETIYSKIRAINDNLRRSIGTDGYRSGVDTGIELALAARTPNGLCTNGIERIDMSSNSVYMANGVRYGGSGITWAELTSISTWNPSQYLNIYLVSEIDNNNAQQGTQGFATFASSHGLQGDSLVSLATHSAFVPEGNTETHELGHNLNLYHTFEGDGTGFTCPTGNQCGPGLGDCCSDTAPHKRPASCDQTSLNSCDNNSPNRYLITNYMNYANCMQMFTQQQKDRARNTLLNIRSSFLASNGNLSLVPPASPTANYISEVQTICAGQKVHFYDRSSCTSTIYSNTSITPSVSFHWVFTSGLATVSSTLQNPFLSFSVPGTYSLNYTVTNSFGSSTVIFPNAITVTGVAALSCIPTSNFQGSSGYAIFNMFFNTITNYTQQGLSEGYRDFSCTKNTIVNAGEHHWLQLTMSSITLLGATLYMQAYIDYNNNGIFEPAEKIDEAQVPPFNSSFNTTTSVPIPIDAVSNRYIRMRLIASTAPITDGQLNCSENFEIADIEDYGVYISNPLALPDFEDTASLFPNPVKDELTIKSPQTIEKIEVYSNLGQLIFENKYQQKEVNINLNHFANGVYLVSIYSEGKRSSHKIIKE